MAQQQQHAAALACKLIKELHGDVAEKVARHCVSKGLQTLPDIIRSCDLPPPQVKQALLLLMQQNYLAAYQHREEEGVKNARPPYYLYEPRLDRMLQIIRYPRFLLHIKEEMGDEAERIIEILLQIGRLSLDQVVRAVAARLEVDPGEVQERVRNIFMSLVQSHYIERCAPCNLPPPKLAPHPSSVKGRKSGAKAGSAQMAQEQGRAVRGLEEMAFEKVRFKLPPELIIDMAMEGEGMGKGKSEADAPGEDKEVKPPPAKKQRVKAGTAATTGADAAAAAGGSKGAKAGGAKGPEEPSSAALAAAAAAAATPSTLLWRVNCEEFNRRFRHRCCVSMVAEKIDADAGHVLAAMLTASRPFEARLKEDRSTTVSVDEVNGTATRLIETGVLPSLSASLPTIINTIAHDALELISFIGNGPGGEQYMVNMGRILELVKLKQVEAVIRDRFTASGLRIFRLLLLKGQLEQKQVTDFSMLSPKDTRELLYKMLKGGFLSLQEIPRTSDRAPSRTLYTWRANYEGAGGQLGGELYAAAGHVWARIRHEMARERELLELVEESRAKGELNFTLTAAQRQAAQRLKRAVDTLETSLLQLDEMISIFNEF